MSQSGRRSIAAAALIAVAAIAPVTRAGVFQDVALGLGYAGFDIEGSRNVLSGGADFSISRNLRGNPLDFGAWDLTLRGPVSLNLSTGGRGLPQFEFAFTTAIDSRAVPTPLGYTLNYDVGGQATQIDGTVLLDARFSINGFGFYDLEFTYSSRQDVASNGRFANDDRTFDADFGPINVSGNIFADALALVTQPLFQEAGQSNPFISFSGRGSIAELLTAPVAGALKSTDAGGNPVEEDRYLLLAPTAASEQLDNQVDRRIPPNSQSGFPLDTTGAAVPEPTVLLLMLLGLPAVMRRRPRRRKSPHAVSKQR